MSSVNHKNDNQEAREYRDSRIEILEFTIFGEPCSKANSRRLVWHGASKTPRFIKSKKALQYQKDFQMQCPVPPSPLEGSELKVTMKVFYRTQRPDLDESLILDLLEKCGVYRNDRLVREKHIYHFIDRKNPRTEICIGRRLKADAEGSYV